jgi:twitching motility protein PilT
MEITVENILNEAIKKGASDVHISTGKPAIIRIDDDLIPYKKEKILNGKDTARLVNELMDVNQQKLFEDNKEVDFAYNFGKKARFRTNIFIQRGSCAAALRLVPRDIKTIEELDLPQVLKEFTNNHQGLFLAVGPAGHGKSTTIASMIDLINRNRAEHIITIEDPIEYIFTQDKSIINQREVFADTLSFQRALRSALRQDPDVLFVGEMRDLETISTALTIAETGHLVFSTLHTNNASETIDRMIDVFPPHQQEQIRFQIASSLLGIISQRLIPRKDGGRVPATEILKANTAIRNTIREGKTYQIVNSIQTGSAEGMMTLDSSLVDLVKKNKINKEDAIFYSTDKSYIEKSLANLKK